MNETRDLQACLDHLSGMALSHAVALDVTGALLRAFISTHSDQAALEAAFRAELSRDESNPAAWKTEGQPLDERERRVNQAYETRAANWLSNFHGKGDVS